MAEFPALPLFTDALLADTDHLSDAEFGLYLRILIAMWRSPNCQIPNDKQWLSKRFRQPIEIIDKDLMRLIAEFCVNSGNSLTQKRLLKEYNYLSKKRQNCSVAARSMWAKKKEICERICENDAPHPTPPSEEKRLLGKTSLKEVLPRSRESPSKPQPAIPPQNSSIEKPENVFEAFPDSPEYKAWVAYYLAIGEKFSVRYLTETRPQTQPFTFSSRWPPGYQPPANGKATTP
jgi:uncharacterized protein YdaU (DUF1376 family)